MAADMNDTIIRVLTLLGEHDIQWMLSDKQRVQYAEIRGRDPETLILLSNGLMERHRDTGDLTDLQEAAEFLRAASALADGGSESLVESWKTLSIWFRIQFSETSAQAALEGCTECHKRVLALSPQESQDRVTAFLDLITSLQVTFSTTNGVGHLKEAVGLYEQAVASYPSEAGVFAPTLNDLIECLCSVWTRTRDPADLETPTRLLDQALSLFPDEITEGGQALFRIAITLRLAYLEDLGNPTLLARTIRFQREALIRRPPGHVERAPTLTALANALDDRFQESGEERYIEEAIRLHREALHLRPPGHPARDVPLDCLGVSLYSRYTQLGDLSSLAEATQLHREALELRPVGHVYRVGTMDNLGNCLENEFQNTGDLRLLDEAIQLHKDALDLLPQRHSDRDAVLVNLSLTLEARLRCTGDLEALNDAIRYGREAASLCPPGHLHHFDTLTNLAVLQDAVAEYFGAPTSLEESIKSLQDALLDCPPEHPSRDSVVGNLAVAFEHLYDQTRVLTSLDDAARHYENALQLRSSAHPSQGFIYNGLSRAMYKRYKAIKDTKDLQRAIELPCDALRLFPEGHPQRHACLLRLCEGRLHKGTPSYDPSAAIENLAEAVVDVCASSRDRLKGVADTLAEAETYLFGDGPQAVQIHRAVLEVYKQTIQLLPRVAYFGLGLADRLRELKGSQRLGTDAAKHALALLMPEVALELLEESRSVFWAQALRMRSSLIGVPNEAIAELTQLFSAVEQGVYITNAETTLIPAWGDPALVERRRQSERAEHIIDEIRRQPGLERFLLTQPFSALSEAAAKGSVVVLIAHETMCHAIALTGHGRPPQCIPLPQMTSSRLRAFAEYVKVSNVRGRAIKKSKIGQAKVAKNQPAASKAEGKESILGELNGDKLFDCLWHQVIKPILDALGLERATGRARPRLHWCATGAFAFLPLHAAGWCSDYVVSSYTPTLTSLIQARRGLKLLRRCELKALLVSEPFAPGLNVIENVMEEVQVVNRILSPISPQVVGDLDACAPGKGAQVREVMRRVSETSILHLACHGQQDPSNPLASSFCLRDGRLSVADLMRLNLSHAFFAYLSACESAKGDHTHPDQVVHLAAAMLFVGFRSVIGTMWEMGDADGPFVAAIVYEEVMRDEILDPDSIPYALDLAIHKLRQRRLPPHRWAPYIHVGA